jgi:uncharacterized RDD family membrane protein YckC
MTAIPAPTPGVYAKQPTQVLGRRGVALFIDSLIVSAMLAPFWISWFHVEGSHLRVEHQTELQLIGLSIGFFYWWILESLFGATIGKFIAGIRVRKKDGGRAGIARCFVRNIIRIVPFYWLVGWIIALASGPRRQRLFDMLAGTVVIRSTYA